MINNDLKKYGQQARKCGQVLSLWMLVGSSCLYPSWSIAQAYVFIGGGGAYALDRRLESTNIISNFSNPSFPTYAIQYHESDGFSGTGRVALGYYFKKEKTNTYNYIGNQSQALLRRFGLEAGYNYFGTIKKNSVGNQLPTSDGDLFSVLTAMKSNLWSVDLDAIFSQDFSSLNTAVFFKLGIVYAHMAQKIANTLSALPDVTVLPETESLSYKNVGATVGIGIQHYFSKNSAVRLELNAVKGGEKVGYAQLVVGLLISM